MARTKSKSRKDWVAELNNRVLEMLEKGRVPWRQPWIANGPPLSFASGEPYKGIVNSVVLNTIAAMHGFESRYWITFGRAKQEGGHVMKGQSGSPIVWASRNVRKEEDPNTGEVKEHAWMSAGGFLVWNLNQVMDVEHPGDDIPVEVTIEPVDACEKAFWGMPQRPRIIWGGDEAFYNPITDTITLPRPARFAKVHDFWGVVWHEIAHWAVRHELGGSSNDRYSYEELVAESASHLLCLHCGITPDIENDASYISGWLARLGEKDHERWFMRALVDAQKIVDAVLGIAEQEQGE